MSDPEDIKPEDETNQESKPFVDEETSFSFLFFITAGALLFVTLWSFWDDEFTRRGFKQYQGEYFKTQSARGAGDSVSVLRVACKASLWQLEDPCC